VQTPAHDTSVPEQRQCPVAQARPPEQLTPQAPQLEPLVWRSTHAEPHIVRSPTQPIMHMPAEHTWLARQPFPQAPQLAASLVVSTHWLAQSIWVPGQPHVPPVQV
jgi:hypothetical protein